MRIDWRKLGGQSKPFALWMWVPNGVIRRADMQVFDHVELKFRPVVVIRDLQNGRLEVLARSASVPSKVAHRKHSHRPEDELGDVACATTKDGFIVELRLYVKESDLDIEYERCLEPSRTDFYRYLRAASEAF